MIFTVIISQTDPGKSGARTGMPDRPEAVGGDQVNVTLKSRRHGDWVGLGEGFCKKGIQNFFF